MFTGRSSRWGDPTVFLLFGDGSSLVGRFPRSFSRTSHVRSHSSSSSLSSDLSPPASELALRWGLLGQASTPLDQSIDGMAEKYTARSCPWIFKSRIEYIVIKKELGQTNTKTLTAGGRFPTLKALYWSSTLWHPMRLNNTPIRRLTSS